MEKKNLGEAIYSDIDNNEYLNKIYQNILYNYSLKLFDLRSKQPVEINHRDALRFADILSKSTHPEKADSHKIWAQAIVALLRAVNQQDESLDLFFGSILANTGNLPGKAKLTPAYTSPNLLDRAYAEFAEDFLLVPGQEPNVEKPMRFLRSQKAVYDRLTEPYLSYSGPTSMGKSFIMRTFIREQIVNNLTYNYCILVPTKALINEVSSEIIQELNTKLKDFNYRVVTSAGALVLDKDERPHLIFVLTPERLQYLLINDKTKGIPLDYLFIDEAHKISTRDSRSTFYYNVVTMLEQREHKPHIIFASPNIPNPKLYLKLIPSISDDTSYFFRSTFSPVVQVKYLLDLIEGEMKIYNEYTKKLSPFYDRKSGTDMPTSFIDWVLRLEKSRITKKNLQTPDEISQTIVYVNSKNDAVDLARLYAKRKYPLPNTSKNDPELIALAKEIKGQINPSYFLADLITKGIAYHIGYLPASIRRKIEDLYRKQKIDILFCTSTLIEGVNLPADNLFITTYKRGPKRQDMSEVDFRNLVGRVGRIKFNLYGNVFLTRLDKSIKSERYQEFLITEVPDQTLSISVVTELEAQERKLIVDCLLQGDKGLTTIASMKNFAIMRKFSLILLRDIMKDRNSLVRKTFADCLNSEIETKIISVFNENENKPNDDINTSVDQAKGIFAKIRNENLRYPVLGDDAQENYQNVVYFLNQLHTAFKWEIYEKETKLQYSSNFTWLSLILLRWIDGQGLGQIISQSIDYYERNPDKFYMNHKKVYYEYRNPTHKNHVIGETLEVIENTLLFSISNYFHKFSDAYKTIHDIKGNLSNDWYEYVEYGTMNQLTIMLQRNGFTRETAMYIKEHKVQYVVFSDKGEPQLRSTLKDCDNEGVRNEVADMMLNVHELFVK